MREINIISPIKKPEDIEVFTKNTTCRDFYVYHHKFLGNNFDYIQEFIDVARKNNSRIYINFKHNISEEDLVQTKKFINYLKNIKIDGLCINSFAILEFIKTLKLPFKIIIDSYFDIHNLAGIDFVNMYHKIDQVIITEEIYLKNISKIKKYTNLSLAIDTDNLPWCAEDIKKLDAIDSVVIKGKFANSESILDAILLIEQILQKPKMFKKQKLPFKHIRKSSYMTNHFSGEMISAEGKDFKFSRNIQKYEWEHKHSRLKKDFDYSKLKLPNINLRITSIEQLKELKKFITKIGFNPIYSIEFGEILNTSDLYKSDFNTIIKYVKKFCVQNNIKMQLSTPRILIERDFERVYEYVKNSFLEEPHPYSIVVNNIGYLWTLLNDSDYDKIPVEIGQGINLLNSMSIECLNNMREISSIDFTPFTDINNIKKALKKINDIIPTRKITIAGNVRVPSLGLCPLNNASAMVSRLSCKAPCHNGTYALKDPSLDKLFPFVVDGFCRMHMFQDKILHMYHKIDEFEKMGINEFVIDLSSLNAKFVNILLTNLLNYRAGFTNLEINTLNIYGIEK